MAQKIKITSTPSRKNRQRCLSILLTIRTKQAIDSGTNQMSPRDWARSSKPNEKQEKKTNQRSNACQDGC